MKAAWFAVIPFLLPFLLQGASAQTGNPDILVDLAKRVVPSVVNISSSSTVKGASGHGSPDEMFRRFFEEFFGRSFGSPGFGGGGGPGGGETPQGHPHGPKAVSLGTGFVIDADGLILTNAHVVVDAEDIRIVFTEDPTEKPTEGKVVGRDPDLDIALIRVKTSRKLAPLVLGDSDALQVGQYVIAVGNPFGQGHSVTHGIISAKGRVAPEFPIATYLQTDAPINPGNSGGPLVDLKGEVIGINNAIDVRAQGIGFAIPSSAVKTVLHQLETRGKVERAYLGLVAGDLSPEIASKIGAPKDLRAPFVTSVTPGTPAEKAGVKPYDIIKSVNGQPVSTPSDLVTHVAGLPVGSRVALGVVRDGKDREIDVHSETRPNRSEVAVRKGKKPARPERNVDPGVEVEDLTPSIARELGVPEDSTGALVDQVQPGGSAEQAGLSRGDIIVEIDRKPIHDARDFYSAVNGKNQYLLRVRKTGASGGGADVYTVVMLDLSE
jgi:serine protease Do